MVPKAGFEPAWVAPHAPQTCVSTRFHHFGMLIYYYKNSDVFKRRVMREAVKINKRYRVKGFLHK